jgi:hypothetical protein
MLVVASETPLGKSTRVSGILFDSFLATWSLLVRRFYALGVSWGYGKIREGRWSALIAVACIPINALTVQVKLAPSSMSGNPIYQELTTGCEMLFPKCRSLQNVQ